MTVAELIANLQEMPQEARVIVCGPGSEDDAKDIGSVDRLVYRRLGVGMAELVVVSWQR